MDPEAGYSSDRWNVSLNGPEKIGASFRVTGLSREYVKGAGISRVAFASLISGDIGVWDLTSADNLDDVVGKGVYGWASSAPTNAPFGSFALMEVLHRGPMGGTIIVQRVSDANNQRTVERYQYSGVWSRWKPLDGLEVSTSSDLANAAAPINAGLKFQGKAILLSNTSAIAVANGSGSTSSWNIYNRDASVTPS